MSDQAEFLMQLGSVFLNVSVCCSKSIPQFMTTCVPLKNYVVNIDKIANWIYD